MADVEGQETREDADDVKGETNNGYELHADPDTVHMAGRDDVEERGAENETINGDNELQQDLLTDHVTNQSGEGIDSDDHTWLGCQVSRSGWKTKLKVLPLYLAFFSLGMDTAIVGPSLPDLQLNTSTTINKIAILFTLSSIGYLIGSLLGGICFDKLGRGMISLALLSSGAMGALVPWCDNLPSLLFVFAIIGLVDGCLDSGGNAMCVTLRNKKYMRTLHLVYAFGAIVAPLLTSPFLSSNDVHVLSTSGTTPPASGSSDIPPAPNTPTPIALSVDFSKLPNGLTAVTYEPVDKNKEQKPNLKSKTRRDVENINFTDASISESSDNNATLPQTNGNLQTTGSLTMGTTKPPGDKSVKTTRRTDKRVTIIETSHVGDAHRDDEKEQSASHSTLWIPWTIVAIYKALVAFIFFAMFCCGSKPSKLPKRERTSVKNAEGTRSRSLRIILLICLFMFYFLCQGQEGLYGAFLYSFALHAGLGFTPILGGLLNSLFWVGFTISRAIGGYCAYHFSQITILITNLVGLCTFSFILAALNDSSPVPVWICTPFLGFFLAAMFPSGTSWAEQYIMLTSKVTATFLVAGSLSQIILPWPAETIFYIYDVSVLTYITAVMAGITAVIYILMQIIAVCDRRTTQTHIQIQNNEFVCEENTSES